MHTRMQLYPALILLAAIALLVTFSVQYPLSTTFPIGGDAAAHIRIAKQLINPSSLQDTWLTLRTSNYPLSQLLFTSTAALPLDWPDRFAWWMSAGHILTGLALGALLWRIASWRAAAAGMAIWALTPIGINTHFEDGTAPQLWSLVFLVLAYERLVAGSIWGTLVMVVATTFAHFLSGFILIASLVMGTILLLPVRRRLAPKQAKLIKYLGLLIAALTMLAAFKIAQGINWPFVERQSEDFFLIDMLKSKFAPWLVLSIPGLAIITSKLRFALPAAASLLSFFWLSFLLTANSSLNVGLWENRFRTYLIIAIAIAAGLALPALTRSALRHFNTRLLFLGLFFITLATLTWRDNAATYRYYEDPASNARLSSPAKSALDWLAANLPPTSFIASSAASRHSEWIPVLTPHRWQELNASHELLTLQDEELYTASLNEPFTHIIFLTNNEDVSTSMLYHPDWFPIVFQNSSAVIIQLP